MSERRKDYPSESRVKTGVRVVPGEQELTEKRGRDDRCPCGSGKSVQTMLPEYRR